MKATSNDLPIWVSHIATREFQGVKFYDILPLLAHHEGLFDAIKWLDGMVSTAIGGHPLTSTNVDLFAGVESRGFIFSSIMAHYNDKGLLLIRKAGKTPGDTVRMQLSKEYGKDEIEIQKGLFEPGTKIVIVDDVIATGGTLLAAAKLIEQLGGHVVAIATLLELTEVKNEDGRTGRQLLEDAGYKFTSVIQY